MKKGTVLNLKHYNKVFEFLKLNNIFIILTVLFIGGLCFGVYFLRFSNDFSTLADGYITNFIDKRIDAKFIDILINSFYNSLLFIMLTFVCGSSMLGVILIPLVCFANGGILGVISANLFSEHSLNGIAFYTVIILPCAVISVIALILSARESIRFSLLLARLTFPTSPPQNLSYSFKQYCVKYLSFVMICFASALVDAIISSNFLDSLKI